MKFSTMHVVLLHLHCHGEVREDDLHLVFVALCHAAAHALSRSMTTVLAEMTSFFLSVKGVMVTWPPGHVDVDGDPLEDLLGGAVGTLHGERTGPPPWRSPLRGGPPSSRHPHRSSRSPWGGSLARASRHSPIASHPGSAPGPLCERGSPLRSRRRASPPRPPGDTLTPTFDSPWP